MGGTQALIYVSQQPSLDIGWLQGLEEAESAKYVLIYYVECDARGGRTVPWALALYVHRFALVQGIRGKLHLVGFWTIESV